MHDETFRVGIDVGGTFTDGVIININTGEFEVSKVPTTPEDPAQGFLHCITRVLDQIGASPEKIDSIIHGTTVATNAIFELKLARTGLITNEGFTDVLEVGRMDRPKLSDLLQQRPTPLVPGRWRRGVRCRIDADGAVVQDLDRSDVETIVEYFKQEAIEAIAICFLHSYKNPSHEIEVEQIVRDLYPEAHVSSSFQVVPLHGETARMSTTVINAALMPTVALYLANVEEGLEAIGFAGRLYLLQSNGGTIRAEQARSYPAWMIESGPAAGVIGAAYLGSLLGIANLISFDMGGTTAKVGLVKDGNPEIITEFEVGSMVRSKTYESGGGYPLKTPAIDMAEVGAGGGSIGWLDAGGALRVGPQSAGADPGPACYDKGGNHPTVSDANLVVGKLNPENFLGGEMRLRPELANEAIDEQLAKPLQKSVSYCAQGIVEVADANMERVMKVISSMRGYDPRDYAVLAFGGSGPVHVASIAQALQLDRIIIPPHPGVFTSIGLLLADLKYSYTQAFVQQEGEIEIGQVQDVYGRLEKQAFESLEPEGIHQAQIDLVYAAELRYVGQLYTIVVPAPSPAVGLEWIPAAIDEFHEAHLRLYGHSAPGDEPVEMVALHLTALGSLAKPEFARLEQRSGGGPAPVVGHREVLFQGAESFVELSVYDRADLRAGDQISGPATVEQFDSTTVVPPGYGIELDTFGNLIIARTHRVMAAELDTSKAVKDRDR